jgi:hypothetical protein
MEGVDRNAEGVYKFGVEGGDGGEEVRDGVVAEVRAEVGDAQRGGRCFDGARGGVVLFGGAPLGDEGSMREDFLEEGGGDFEN